MKKLIIIILTIINISLNAQTVVIYTDSVTYDHETHSEKMVTVITEHTVSINGESASVFGRVIMVEKRDLMVIVTIDLYESDNEIEMIVGFDEDNNYQIILLEYDDSNELISDLVLTE